MFIQLPENGAERYVELMNLVQEMFRDVAAFSIRRRIKEEQKGLAFSEEHATECAAAIRRVMLQHEATHADAHRFAREARRRLLREDPPSKLAREGADDEEFIFSLTMLFLTWYTILLDGAVGEPMDRVLDVSDFGDDMLPPRLSESQLTLMDENLSPTTITPDEFRGFLRMIADSHSNGGLLPTVMLEMLSLDGISVMRHGGMS